MELGIAPDTSSFDAGLLGLIESRLAIILTEHRKVDIMGVVEQIRSAGRIRDTYDLCTKLASRGITDPLWQHVIRAATIGETYFFRDRNQIEALQHVVLPEIIRTRQQSGILRLRLWSAGCSTGEEPYSLAMLLRELIPDIWQWDVTILATDLNMNQLERANKGVYRAWSFRSETPTVYRDRWFVPEGESFRIDPTIRSMVTFAPLNLVDTFYMVGDQPISQVDVILCRNVLIYFDKATVSAIIQRLHGTLDESGWLVLGHSETAHMTGQPFGVRHFEGATLYQKVSASYHLPPVENTFFNPQPVSNPTLLAPRISHKPIIPAVEKPEPKPVSAPVVTEALDPWTLAHHAANRENWEEALQCLAEAEQKSKLRPEVHYLRGIIELQQNEVEKSLASLRRALYCKSDFVLAHFTIGEVFEKMGQFKKAANHWTQAHHILRALPPEQPIEYSDQLTVEMLLTVLEFRLENLNGKVTR